MERFVASQNVERYRRLLKTEADAQQRKLIEQLLADAIASLNDATQRAPIVPSPDS